MNYLIDLKQNNGYNSQEIIFWITGPGDDHQVKVNMERTGRWDGVAGPRHICWLFAHGYAAAVARREMCSFKAPETTTSLPTTNAVNQLSGVQRRDETSFLFLHFLCGRVPY